MWKARPNRLCRLGNKNFKFDSRLSDDNELLGYCSIYHKNDSEKQSDK